MSLRKFALLFALLLLPMAAYSLSPLWKARMANLEYQAICFNAALPQHPASQPTLDWAIYQFSHLYLYAVLHDNAQGLDGVDVASYRQAVDRHGENVVLGNLHHRNRVADLYEQTRHAIQQRVPQATEEIANAQIWRAFGCDQILQLLPVPNGQQRAILNESALATIPAATDGATPSSTP